MECLRKIEAKSKKSKNRMPSIVESGALAAATTVKPHSLTSNNSITPIASFPEEGLIKEFYHLPVPKMPPRRGNINIQDNLNRSLILMILFATCGFVMWNGEEWRASWEKKKKKEKEDEERRLSDCFRKNPPQWDALYDQYIEKNKDYKAFENLVDKLTNDNCNWSSFIWQLNKLIDTFTTMLNSVNSYYRPFFFFDSLSIIEEVLRDHKDIHSDLTGKLDDSNSEVKGIIHKYMPEFSAKDYAEFKETYYKEKDPLSTLWKDVEPLRDEKEDATRILTSWAEKIGMKKYKKDNEGVLGFLGF